MTCQTIGGQAPRGGIHRHPGSGRPGRGHPFAERAAWVLLWDLSGERARWRLPERSRFAAVPGLNAEDVVPGVRRRAIRVTRGSAFGERTLGGLGLSVIPSCRSLTARTFRSLRTEIDPQVQCCLLYTSDAADE